MAQQIGSRNTNQAITEDRVVRSVFPDISMLEPNNGVLITLMMKGQAAKAAKNTKLEWFEDDYNSVWTLNSNNTYNTTDTAIVVTDATLFIPGTMFMVPKVITSSVQPEVIRVVSIVYGTNTLTVVRNVGGGTAASIPANCDIRILSTADEEGSSLPSAITTARVKKTSYMQIFRTTTKFTNTAIAQEVYGANSGDRTAEHRKKLIEHKRKLNDTMYWGRSSEGLTAGPTGQPIRTSMGIRQAIATNIMDAGGVLTRKRMDDFADISFRYSDGGNKFLFCSSKITQAVHSWARSQAMTAQATTQWGVSVTRIKTPFGGSWIVVPDRMLDVAPSGNYFGGQAFSVDMKEVHGRFLSANGENRNTKISMDVVQDGTDAKSDEIKTEMGFVIRQEKRHAYLFNVSDYVE